MLCYGFETFKQTDLPGYIQCGYNKVIRNETNCEQEESENLGLFVLFIWLGCGSDYRFQFWQRGVWVRFQNQPISTQFG